MLEVGQPLRLLARRQVMGEALLRERFPAVHAVGRASPVAPRLVDLEWGNASSHPKVTLVGKGVCFDTGGLDIKPGASMLLMKKDMGGAACDLALAQLIMDAELPSAPARDHSSRGERDFRQCLPSWRCHRDPQGHVGGNRQHRRGRSADPGDALALADEDSRIC